jgi:hypothetical protein
MTVTAVADTKIALVNGRPTSNHTTGPADVDDLSALIRGGNVARQREGTT